MALFATGVAALVQGPAQTRSGTFDRPSAQPPGARRLHPERPGFGDLAAILYGSEGFAFSSQNGQGEPTRFDPCRPITVIVSADLAPDAYIELVDGVLAEVSDASGLEFEVEDYDVDERANVQRPAYDPGRYGDRWSPVLIAWSTPLEYPPLQGDILGWADNDDARDQGAPGDQRRWYVSGTVVLDASELRDDDVLQQRLILLHELGHLVGLDHVTDPQQIMFPMSGATRLGHGDLRGLALLGAGNCAPSL